VQDIITCLKEIKIDLKEVDEIVIVDKFLFEVSNKRKEIKEYLEWFKKNIYIVDHHTAHLASAFYSSQFKYSNIISIDGKWDWASCKIAYWENNKILEVLEIPMEYSLWRWRNAMNTIVGFPWHQYSGKTMALSSLWTPRYYDSLMEFVLLEKNWGYIFHLWDKKDTQNNRREFFNKENIIVLIEKITQKKRRTNNESLENIHYDIVASLQKMTNEIVQHMVQSIYAKTKCTNLCLAWGVALNWIMNSYLANLQEVENIFIQPAANDAWLSLWAGQYINHHIQNMERKLELFNPYLGRNIKNSDIEKYLKIYWENIKYTKCENIFKETSEILAQNKIIAWVQDKEEYGPRALWNRSILASPIDKEMKNKINTRIKHREDFRPFAPAILEEDVSNYFEKNILSPYMLLIEMIKKDKQKDIPAVVHHDWTWRIQTVSKESSPKLHKLISEFKNITWVPILLNTSLNDNWEPIVWTIEDAILFFLKNDIDFLMIDSYLIQKL